MTHDSSAGRPVVFLSYATSDHLECHILTRLKAQPIQVWNFQAPGEQIAPGEDIKRACERRIDESNTFALLVSNAAFDSDWVKFELHHALERRRNDPLDLIVIVDKGVEPSEKWPEPFRKLRETMKLSVDFSAMAGIESAVFKICNHLEAKYAPPPIEEPRLPFMTLLFEEFEKVLGNSPYEAAVYDRLLRILMEFYEEFKKEDYPKATAHLDYFIQSAEHEYPNSRLWYPHILRAVCDCLQRRYPEALKRLSQINMSTSACPAPPRLRSTVHATIAYVYYHQKDFRAAADSYSRAIDEYPDDATDRCNLVIATLEAGGSIDKARAFTDIDGCSLLEGDKSRIELAKARVCALTGSHHEAMRRFDSVVKTGAEDVNLVSPFALYLRQIGQCDRARKLMRVCVDAHQSDVFARLLLAKLHEECGDSDEAADEYRKILQQCPDDSTMHVQALRGLWSTRNRKEALALAKDILTRFTEAPPCTSDEYLAAGAANWITGDRARAEYDFERSRKPRDRWHYSKYLNQ